MKRPRGASLSVILWITVVIGRAAGVAVHSSGDTLETSQLQLGDVRDQIAAEVDTMQENLNNLTEVIQNADVVAGDPTKRIAFSAVNTWKEPREKLPELVLLRNFDRMQTIELDMYESAAKLSQPEPDEHSFNTMSLEADDDSRGKLDPLPPCNQAVASQTLGDSAAVLDQVAYKIFTTETLSGLTGNNSALASFVTGCAFKFDTEDQKKPLLQRVSQVQKHIAPAHTAVAPEPKPGVTLDSAYMIMFITLSVVLGVLLLTGLAVLSYKYAQVQNSPPRKRPVAAARGGGRAPSNVTGHRNPAYEGRGDERAPAAVHETENWRWRRQPDAEPRDPEDDPVSTRHAKQSTWGRIWGGVVRDYERHTPATREPTQGQMMPRAQAQPGSGYTSDPAPERRSSDRPEERRQRWGSHDGAGDRRSPGRRGSPPPQLRRPSPAATGGGNWSYGAPGRQKSSDSPFTSAW